MRRFFYSKEEFESQYQDYIDRGLSPAEALTRVQANEQEDREEYERWLDEQDQARRWGTDDDY
mgnify:CR=1 FL=1